MSRIDTARADHAVAFVRALKHGKGRWAGVPFNLADWQERILRELLGSVNKDGTRQYRTAYVSMGRKNGKTELGAAIALYLLFADGEAGAEIYSAAADRDQAAIVFHAAASMVRQAPALSRRCRIIDSQKRIVRYDTGSVYRALSADAYTKHGYNPSAVIYDELHAAPNRDLWDVLTTGSGTRTQPLFLAITTAGYDRNSICWEQYDYAKKIQARIIDDPTFYPCIHELPEDADWTDDKLWPLANPALGDFLSWDEMRAQFRKTLATPGLQNPFRRLRLNQWTQVESRWLDIGAWDACGAQIIDPERLRGRVCYAGLDLASTTDIAALVLDFPTEDGDTHLWLPYFFIPADSIAERARRDRVPYDVWARQGRVIATPGNVIDYAAIEAKINQLVAEYELREIAYDRWGAAQISQRLTEAGLTMIPMGQGMASMGAPTKELERLVLAGRLQHGGHPVLRWMADNCMVEQDAAGNLKPSKAKSTEKIDGIVAGIMALDRAVRHAQHASVYETRGIQEL